MKHVLLASVVIGLMASSRTFAQNNGPPAPASAAAVEPAPPLPPALLPPPRAALIEPAPPGPPPLAPTAAPPPPVFTDAALDGFATRWWVGVDYLLWWTKGDSLPPLITSGAPNDLVPGAIGQPGTQTLFGGDYDSGVRSGVRLRGGYWFTPDQTFGIDGTFFFLGGQSASLDDSSNGDPVLARPFFNVNTGREDSFLVAYPGTQSGEITAALSTRLWGADLDLRGMLFRGAYYQVNLLGGFRFLDLHDSLGMKENDTVYSPIDFGPMYWTTTTDRFHTSNQFYGGQIGADMMWCRGRFFIDVLGKVALGVSVENAGIDGSSSYTTPQGQSGSINAGQLALPSNIGRYGQDNFAVVPEFGINFGYALTPHIRLTFGYTFLYWSNVMRAGDQIDRGLNPTELTALTGNGPLIGPARPNFPFQSTDFWA
ncbi:MAG TPA: BBP7 family outer membrane beta-barrel protein, partial [Gemmataceae bacterium]|nr:BBP7 family outer membrane beta-barrel protein [Gemmataceae bacterium]